MERTIWFIGRPRPSWTIQRYRGGISIHIEKRIPLGAGLGGGSSNAATTLKALNQLLEMGLGQKEMMTMGVKIGADVPFFFLEKGADGHRHWRAAERD